VRGAHGPRPDLGGGPVLTCVNRFADGARCG
jgi:hypothetical protein